MHPIAKYCQLFPVQEKNRSFLSTKWVKLTPKLYQFFCLLASVLFCPSSAHKRLICYVLFFPELKHRKLLSTLRSPTRRCPVTKPSFTSPTAYGKSKLLKSPGDNSFIRIEEVDPTDMNVKIEEAPLNIPKFNHASKAKLPKINLKGLMSNSKQKNAARESTTPPPKQPSKRVPCLKGKTNQFFI